MARYVAFLRGVSPMNAKMPELVKAFEKAGFGNVKTLLSSGNVAFDAAKAAGLEKRCEQAMEAHLGRTFATIIRAQSALQQLIEADPFADHDVPDDAKRVVTFLRNAPAKKPKLPHVERGVHLLEVRGVELLSAYVVNDEGPVFMQLIEKTFGKDVTTRTWDTVRKAAVK